MKYLAVLGRQPEISCAELEALFKDVRQVSKIVATFESDISVDIRRLGGSIKIAELLGSSPLEFLQKAPEGKITFGVSDYSEKASAKTATKEALRLKNILTRHGRSVRAVMGQSAALSSATTLYNGLSGKSLKKVELTKLNDEWYRVVGVQDINAYARRDQARPARDAFVGMLPPKLAQILINLCGPLAKGAVVLDPFCGTGVVLQEALLMDYKAYGTDLSAKMVDYSEKNLNYFKFHDFKVEVGDATNYKWQGSIDAVACEAYLGKPMSEIPTEMKLKAEKQECQSIIVGFLKNLSTQIEPGTPVVVAVPAWKTLSGEISRLNILDIASEMGYNVKRQSIDGLIYHRDNQIVARDILILRKK